MDLGKLITTTVAEEGAFLHLRHPRTDEPLMDEETGEAVGLHLVGRDSADYRRVSKSQQNRRLERMQRTGSVETSADEIEANEIEILVACTKSWKHIQIGELLECTPLNARRLYKETGLRWIRDQVDAFIGKRANLLGNL